MPTHHELIQDLLGGDPIAGSQALSALLADGEAAEDALLSQRFDSVKTVQAQRRLLRYVASRQSTVAPRLLDRIKSNQFGDAYSTAFLCAALDKPSWLTGELYTSIKDRISNNRPGDADAALMAYGYAGADGASIWHLIKDDSHAWEKLSTFAFRSASASFARINTGSDWVLEQLITHRWNPDDTFEIETIPDAPDASIHRIAIDNGEITMQSNYAFLLWRRGDVADQVLRDWSGHTHWRVRWFGAQILSSLGFQRTVSQAVQWLRTEQVPAVRAALLDTLERSESNAGADALLNEFESSHAGAYPLAKVGWRASDKTRAAKALMEIAAVAKSIAGAEAFVSLGRLGVRHPDLNQALDSHDHYRRLNGMLALGYLGDQKDVPRLTQMRAEAANALERIYVAAALALLNAPGAASELHRQMIAAAEEEDFSKRVDIFYLHHYLQEAILGGFAACGPEATHLLDCWRMEFDPLQSLPDAPSPVPAPSPSPAAAAAAGPAKTDTLAAPTPPSQPRSEQSPPAASSAATTLRSGEPDPAPIPQPKDEPEPHGGPHPNQPRPDNETNDTGLFGTLGKIAGIAGIGAGVLLTLYRTLVFPQLEAKQANLFMILIYAAAIVMFALWAYQWTKKLALPVLILIFGFAAGWLGRSTLRAESNQSDVYRVRVRAISPDQSAVTRAKVSSSLGGDVHSVEGGWEIEIPKQNLGDKPQLTISATVEDLGLTGSTTMPLSSEAVQTTTLELKKAGELPVRGIVEDSVGNSIPNALVSVPGYGKDAVLSDGTGNFQLPSHAVAGQTVALHAEKSGFKPANVPDFKVGGGPATLVLAELNSPATTPYVRTPSTGPKIPKAAARPGEGQAGSNQAPSIAASNSSAARCSSFEEFQGDESALATLAEKAFSKQSYECTIVYLEQARKVQASGVWERDYPLLAASYLLDHRDRNQFKSTLQDMLAEMRRPNAFLHHGPPIGMALSNVTNVRFYVDKDAQNYLDQVTAEAINIRSSLAS